MSVDLSRYKRRMALAVAGAPKDLTDQQKAIFREAFGPIIRAEIERQRAEHEAATSEAAAA